jgi:hypothetical protein
MFGPIGPVGPSAANGGNRGRHLRKRCNRVVPESPGHDRAKVKAANWSELSVLRAAVLGNLPG